MRKGILALLLCLVVVQFAQAGKIVLMNDEWTLSDAWAAWLNSNDPDKFALNVADWFTEGTTGDFLVYSDNFGLTGNYLASTMSNAGYSWTVTTDASYLEKLSTYDAVFLCGNPVNTTLLTEYVNNGGNVLLQGGVGNWDEASVWNPFLNNFGLGFESNWYNWISGDIAINSTHPIFEGVDYLYQDNGSNTSVFADHPYSQVLVSAYGCGLYAVYESPSTSVPEPGIMQLLLAGLLMCGTFYFRKK